MSKRLRLNPRGEAAPVDGGPSPATPAQAPAAAGPSVATPRGGLTPRGSHGAAGGGPSAREKVDRILARHGQQSFCEELGIDLARGGGDALWQWLCASVLFSARIKSGAGGAACRALFAAGLASPAAVAAASPEAIRRVLAGAGYERYDAKAAGFLSADARAVVARYGGDLGGLRAAAAAAPAAERALLKKHGGVGDGGVDIFFREVQLVWGELFPFADKKALKAARLCGLHEHPASLAELCGGDRARYVRLMAALVRIELAKSFKEF